MDMRYEKFLFSEYSNLKLNSARVAILKADILAYEENGTGTKIHAREAEHPIEITMSFDDVKKFLTTADISVN